MRLMLVVLGPAPASAGTPGTWWALDVDGSDAAPLDSCPAGAVAGLVDALPGRLRLPADHIRWVLASVGAEYGTWLDAGLRVRRAWDLSLSQRILRTAATADGAQVSYAPVAEIPVHVPADPLATPPRRGPEQDAFFDLTADASPGVPDAPTLAAEARRQREAIGGSARPDRLWMLVTAESQGALIAEEMHTAGLPWDAEVHDALLTDILGPRPAEGERPARLQELAEQVAEDLGAPGLNPDSPPSLLRALQNAGVTVDSTRQSDLKQWIDSGGTLRQERARMLEALLEYKARSRLHTANGWHWLDSWVKEGRFHPRYLVGGVVTGRWAAHGGGAMQVPAVVRDAVRADPGHVLTVADASQVEPRILAAMSADPALAGAGTTEDLYREVAEQGRTRGTALDDRSRAKIALLGAMYGSTTGDSAALLPHLRRLYPQAIGLLERAAAMGESGNQVCTWLGRWSPQPEQRWLDAVADRQTRAAESRARSLRRAAGRFTRNFVVQGTAAEWALCWMGELRRRLHNEAPGTQLVFFVHDEVVLHGPTHEADSAGRLATEAAEAAGRLLFPDAPVTFPLTVAQVRSYAEAT